MQGLAIDCLCLIPSSSNAETGFYTGGNFFKAKADPFNQGGRGVDWGVGGLTVLGSPGGMGLANHILQGKKKKTLLITCF